MEDITTYDILDCFGIESPLIFDKKLRTKDDLLMVIHFCICVGELHLREVINNNTAVMQRLIDRLGKE